MTAQKSPKKRGRPPKPKNFREYLADKWRNDVEDLDTTPLAIPDNAQQPPSLQEQIRQFMHAELTLANNSEQYGSYESEDDFDADPLEEDLVDFTSYELAAMDADDNPPLDAPEGSSGGDQPTRGAGVSTPADNPAQGDTGSPDADNEKGEAKQPISDVQNHVEG